MTTDTAALDADIRDFTATVRRICETAPAPADWSPTAPSDDRTPSLRERLVGAGWFDVADDSVGPDFLGPAAVELGRALAPLDIVDDLLGHGVALDAGDIALARYLGPGDTAWLCGTDGAALVEITDAAPIAYVDAQAVAIVGTAPAGPAVVSPAAVDAWITAMTGYLAGLSAGALDLATGYAAERIAFGKPLTHLDAVAKKIADCATASEGLQMAAARRPGGSVLRQAGVAAYRVVKDCHQILGGLGFTLEYPLQRYSRRAEALRSWTPPLVAAVTAAKAHR